MNPSDDVLIEKSIHGDQRAFNVLVERHGSVLLHAAYGLTRDWDEAQDVVQDALVYAYASLSSLRDPERFLPWVRTIILRTFQGYRKKQTRRLHLLGNHFLIEGDDPSVSAGAELPDRALYEKELSSLVHHSLQSLAERNRRIVALYYLENWPIKAIGEFLGLSTDTIKNRLRSARIQMKEEILSMEMLTTQLKAKRIARFTISGSFSGDHFSPFGLNDSLLYQRILVACRKKPLTPLEIAERIDADETYVVDGLASLLEKEVVAEAEPNHYVANFFFPSVSDDQMIYRRCEPYVDRVIQALKENLSAIKRVIDDCSFKEMGFGWSEMHWIVLHEWMQQPPVSGKPRALSQAEINRSIGPLRPDGGRWFLLGHDLTSPFSENIGSRSFTQYDMGRHYQVHWPGSGRLMSEGAFAVAIQLAKGPKTETEILSGLSQDIGREVLAECVDEGFVTRKDERYQLNFPFVWPEDEEKIAEVLRPVSNALIEALDDWRGEVSGLAEELGFDWLLENQPDAIVKGLEGLWGLNQQLQTEGFIQPPPDDNPCWAMWAKTWKT